MSFNKKHSCPCGSELEAGFCCLVGENWNKKPTVITIKDQETLSLSRCYASSLNNCSKSISREHFISKTVLNNFSSEKFIKIQGLHWQKKTKIDTLSKDALVSNVLCVNHNNLLSPFDTEFGKFHSSIIKFNQDFAENRYEEEFKLFCGEDLERWMLKTVCGFVASKQVYKGVNRINCAIPKLWIDILFNNEPFPEGWGLYVDASKTDKLMNLNTIKTSFTLTDNVILSAKFTMNSLDFYLVLANTNKIKEGIIYRPRGIVFKKKDSTKTIEVCWQDPKYNRAIFITHTGDIITQ